jgi:starch synthase (maltosyl-transferring)
VARTDMSKDVLSPAAGQAAGVERVVIPERTAGSRVVVANVSPEVGDGRYSAKAVIGEPFAVECDAFTDGHEKISVVLRYRGPGEREWREVLMRPLGNDRWRGEFELTTRGTYSYSVSAWRDDFATWLARATVKREAGQSLDVEFAVAERMLEDAARHTTESARPELQRLLSAYIAAGKGPAGTALRLELMGADATRKLLSAFAPRTFATTYPKNLSVRVERAAAAFSAWYELFPRSQSDDETRHGTFKDVIARLPYVRNMGFDVLYLTPIHPIGRKNRKGRNNSLVAKETDPGSPYAIGADEGGHDALHPELGTFDDFAALVSAASDHGLEIALDFAIQCSPDHPWIRQHPDWFDWLPDGSIRYAENPPKKYEDIVNVDFYGDAFPALWLALRDVVLFWVEHGVKIFRVDNPHTKPFPFWEWLIREVQRVDADVIFLSEAFTRPKIMEHLAQIGFTQSYSYFTWRNSKEELTEYLTELTRGPARHFMRPNFFANTPDINPHYVQSSGRPGFRVRFVLAATLGGNYGIYSGFELCEGTALPGKEEYANSEKYQLKAWNWDDPQNIRDDIRRINALRRSSPALQHFTNVQFFNAWNDNILYYGKATDDLGEFLLFAVNLDPHQAHGAHFEVPLWKFGLDDNASIEVEDVLDGHRFTWTGKVQHMWLDPNENPYMIWRLHKPAGAA